ncbi:MAG: cofactor-independent phosphoglycerate mutase [Spirochaetales bacterium]|nr:cofactor-independent phosphoglycerate mutase [Spirochaetales bacterium]
MKYVVIITDGAADVPLAELGGKTPLEAANIPHMDSIAAKGIFGTVQNAPLSLPCGSDVAIMAVLGYDPETHYSGRAPIEAVASDIAVSETDWVFRCNIVTIKNNIMLDHSAENIQQDEAVKIIRILNNELSTEKITFYPGVSYRNLMVYHDDVDIVTTPPHNILDQHIEQYLPKGKTAPLLNDLISMSQKLLEEHAVNPLATSIWFWGEGKKPFLENFYKQYKLRGASITGVDLVRGLSKLVGWDSINVPGVTAYFDTNYKGKGEFAVQALEKYDIVCVHIEAPDEAGHKGDAAEKVRALENIDTHIVGPILSALGQGTQPWRILVLPDHPTPCTIRTHTHEPVLFAMLDNTQNADSSRLQNRYFTEEQAAKTGLHIPQGYTLMSHLVNGTL